MKILIHNIGLLAGILPPGKTRLMGQEMSRLETLPDAFLLIDDGRFSLYGAMRQDDGQWAKAMQDALWDPSTEVIDAKGGAVLPCWCDSHTHIVYAGSREGEFTDKIRGLSYEEIAARGGGILNSADLLHDTSEELLYAQAKQRLDDMERSGTGCVEIKSGYGLNTADELKMLRVIKELKRTSKMKIMSTFLGAHAVGRAYAGRQADYVDLVVREMIPAVGREGLADFIDVFCDRGFFTPEETRRILEAGAEYGMRPKIHACELADSGGVKVGVEMGALSVDHLESMSADDIPLLKASQTMPTALPGTSFFLNMPYAPVRRMVDEGLGVAVASDSNPGSTPSGNMKFVVSLACIKQRLLPEEAINAATINGAAAMGLSADYGSITIGKVANCFLTRPIPSLAYIPYSYTEPLVERVIVRGR